MPEDTAASSPASSRTSLGASWLQEPMRGHRPCSGGFTSVIPGVVFWLRTAVPMPAGPGHGAGLSVDGQGRAAGPGWAEYIFLRPPQSDHLGPNLRGGNGAASYYKSSDRS